LQSYEGLLNAWPVAQNAAYIPTRYGETHVVSAGAVDAPPLLLFHGVGDDVPLMWIYNVGELSQHFHVYAVDTIGGPGKSLPNADYERAFGQRAWIGDLLDGLGLEETAAAGVSYGGMLAIEATLAFPQRVTRVVAVAAGAADAPLLRNLTLMLVLLPGFLLPTQRNIRRVARRLSGPNTHFDDAMLEHLRLLFRHYNPRAMKPHSIRRIPDDELRALADRCLWLLGDRDVLADVPKSERRFRELGLNYRIIENAGHSLNHDKPEIINGLIADFALSRM